MNWRDQAQERLQNYEAVRLSYYNIPLEIKRLEYEAQAPGRVRLDKVGGKGGGRQEDKLLDNIVYRQELQWTLESTRQWLEVTERALGCLDTEERLILQRLHVYQEKDGLERLCNELGVEQSAIYRRRNRALEKFTLALYGVDRNPKIAS